jgi:hypothetical protein
MKEEKPSDPVDEIPIKPLDKAKDPFADAYPPGQGPPTNLDDLPMKPLNKSKDPFADAYPPGQGPPEDVSQEKPKKPAAKKPTPTKPNPTAAPTAGAGEEMPLNQGNFDVEEFAAAPVEQKEFKVNQNPKRPPPPAKGADDAEDDKGAMQLEEAKQFVTDFFHPENVANIFDKTWQKKKDGLLGFQKEVEVNKPDVTTIEALARVIKDAMKAWKESNMNMIKESIITY